MRWLDGMTNSMEVFEQVVGDGEGQGNLGCCSPWDHKQSDMTEQLNNNNWPVTLCFGSTFFGV